VPTLLSVNNYYYRRGGAEAVFLGENELLTERDWTVVPFAMSHPKNLPTPWSRYFAEEIEFGSKYSLLGSIARGARVIYSLEARRKLDALLAEVQPDICHAHNIYHHLSPSILGLLHSRGIPVVLTLHDLKIACPAYNMLAADGICERCKGGRLYNVLVHRCIKDSRALSGLVMLESYFHRLLRTYTRCVNRFVVPSRFYLAKLVEWGFAPEQFAYIPNFVRTEQTTPTYEAGGGFLYFGRLSPEKGLTTLIRAAAQSHSRLMLAGTGPQLETLRALADQTGADVTFLGHLDAQRLHQAIRSARAVVLPSEWYENAPMSVLEAYACGRPVIGARIGGIPELLKDGETGLIFDSGNAESLAEALHRLATMPDSTVIGMGRAGRDWVERDFSATAYVERISALFATLLPTRLPAGQAPGACG